MRSSEEIRTAFTSKGCTVVVRDLGQSYRAGGEIIILAPSVTLEKGVTFSKADFAAFDGTGYDGRGRSYSVWIATAGDYVPCTEAEYDLASTECRVAFGSEHRSCSNNLWFARRGELEKTGLSDFGGAFAALGL